MVLFSVLISYNVQNFQHKATQFLQAHGSLKCTKFVSFRFERLILFLSVDISNNILFISRF